MGSIRAVRLAAMTVVVVHLATGCGSAQAEPPPAAPPAEPIAGVLAVQGTSGTVAIGEEIAGVGRVVDGGATVVVAAAAGARTTVEWRSTVDGSVEATVVVDGALELAATDPDGRYVALVTVGEPGAADTIATGRTKTDVVVVDRTGEQFRRTYQGNYLPEGFANAFTPGSPLPMAAFVLEFTPPEAPTHYRVRTLDLESGQLGLPLNLRDKSKTVDQVMAGVSRTQLLAARDGLLFTLYRGHHDEGHGAYAFVHTLGLANGVWCLVVPDEMALADEGGALALTPQGGELVAVSANGTIAKIPLINVTSLTLAPDFDQPVAIGATTDGSPAAATGSADLWVGMGRTLLRVDPTTLATISAVELPVTIEAIAERADGTLVVGGEGQLLSLSPSLAVERTASLPDGLGALHQIITDPRSE